MVTQVQDGEDFVLVATDRSNANSRTEALRIDGNTGAVRLALQLAVYSNANRPSAAKFAKGMAIFNSDDNAPNFSDGTDWRDAMGNLI